MRWPSVSTPAASPIRNKRYYPPAQAPGLWAGIDELVQTSRALAPVEVYAELKVQGAQLSQWADDHRSMFVELDGATESKHMEFLDTCAEYGRFLTDTGSQTRRGRKHEADPWVISLAAARGLTVVTFESPGRARSPDPKIPSACAELGIPCVNIIGLMELLGWKFDLRAL
jgi:sugar phosphate isomerase/epimerase